LQNETDYNVIYIGEEPDFKEFHVYCAVDSINFTHAVEILFLLGFNMTDIKKTFFMVGIAVLQPIKTAPL